MTCFGRCLFLLSLLFCWSVKAQTEGKPWEAEIHAEGFFRNNEYAQPYGTGYTLPGFRLSGQVAYHISSFLSGATIEAGVHTTGFFGARRYPMGTWWVELPHWTDASWKSEVPHLVPLFAVVLHTSPERVVRIGHLDHTASHHLVEPLYNPELRYSADPEMGVQYQVNYEGFRGDAWIDWQSFTFRADRHQEAFTAGLTLEVPLVCRSTYTLTAELQSTATHRGGEISWLRHDTVHSYWASALGLRASYSLFEGDLYAGAYYLPSFLRTEPQMPSGHAFYSQLGYHTPHILAELAYWRGKHFVAPMGAPFVNSRSLWEGPLVKDLTHTSFLGLHARYTFFSSPLVQLSFAARGWYHLIPFEGSSQRFSHSLELYLALSPSFRF